jgi:hypothetical protein
MLHNFCCRQQWNDNRLEFNDQGGKIKYLTMTERSKVGPALQENPIYVFLFWELRGLSPNFHIHVSVSDLYIPRICHTYLAAAKCTGVSWKYINLTQI